MPQDNIDIIPELKRGSHQAFKTVFTQFYPDLYRFAYSYLMNRAQAQDIVQDCFTALWDRRATLPADLNLRSYLFTVTKHACLDHLKHLQVVDTHLDKLTEAVIFSNTQTYENDEEVLQKIEDCIQQMPLQQQTVLRSKIIDGLSYQEIATRMNISQETVHTHVKRAYKYIRENIFDINILILFYSHIK